MVAATRVTLINLYPSVFSGLDFDSGTPAQGEEITKDNSVSDFKSTVKRDSRLSMT